MFAKLFLTQNPGEQILMLKSAGENGWGEIEILRGGTPDQGIELFTLTFPESSGLYESLVRRDFAFDTLAIQDLETLLATHNVKTDGKAH